METRESAKRALEARIVELENRIAVLKHDAKPASRKAGAKMDIQFDALESRLKVLRTRLSEAGREGWAQTKDTTLTALEKAEQKLDELRNEMQKK